MFKISPVRSIVSLAAVAVFLPLAAQAQQLEIVEASYGAGNFQMNVAQKLRGMIQNNVLDFSVDPGLLGGDPAPGSAKRLRVVYRYNGRQYETSAGDFERVHVPSTTANSPVVAPAAAPPAAGGGFSLSDLWNRNAASTTAGLQIVTARYGDGTRSSDVRDRLQSLVRNDTLSLKIDNAAMGGDPAVARDKALDVTYSYRGSTYQTSVREGTGLTLPDPNARMVSASTGTAPTHPTATPAAAATNTLRIASARYGGNNRYADVRDRLQGLVSNNNSLTIRADNQTMGGDPAVGADKSLEVTYEWNGAVYSTSVREDRSLTLPEAGAQPISYLPPPTPVATTPVGSRAQDYGRMGSRRAGGPVATPGGPSRELIPIGTAGGLRIFYARYGAQGQEIDVRERLRPLLQNNAVNTVVGADSMGSDPAPGVMKTVRVIYEFQGRTFEKAAADGQPLVLP